MELAQTWKLEQRNRKLAISSPEKTIKLYLNLKDLSQGCVR